MKPTPRTDEATGEIGALDYSDKGNVVYADFARDLERQLSDALEREKALKAKIDALMMEYCPDEMTPEQIEEWASYQQVAPELEPITDYTDCPIHGKHEGDCPRC